MPYFIQRQGDKHCVMKGVKGQEGNKKVKCHPDPGSAQKHLAALMVNVEDAKSVEEKEISIDERTQRIREGFYAQFSPGQTQPVITTGENVWVKEVYPTYIIAEAGGEKFRVPYISGIEGKTIFSSRDEWIKVEQAWVEAKSQSAVVLDEQSDKNRFISYKSGDDWRWLAISSTAVEDREYETVSEKAYDDAITHASINGYGELDLVHVNGTEVGQCDQMFRVGQSLLEGGTWSDSDLAQKVREIVQENSDRWGVSIKFQYDPEQFDGKVYSGGIRILKRSILPRKMAASLGTAIVVQGGKAMKEIDEATKKVLMELGLTEEKVTELAERQKSLPDEPNVKEKEANEKESVLATLKRLLFGETPETAKPDAVEQPEADTEVEQVETQEKEVETPKELEYVLTEEAVKTISLRTAQVISPAIAKALNPIAQQVQSLVEWSETVTKRLQEVEKDIETKVTEKIASLPPIVKVRTTELKQAEDPTQPVVPAESLSRNEEFVKAVSGIVTQAMGQALGTGKFDL